MSEPTNIIQEEQDAEQRLIEAIEKALDFSEIFADIEHIEKMIEGMK